MMLVDVLLVDPLGPAGTRSAAASRQGLIPRPAIETLLTPYFFVAPWAFLEMNRYRGFSLSLFTRSPAASIAET
jgi:hypothetical protein